MNISKISRTDCLLAAIVVSPVMSMGVEQRACTPGQPTEESYTWNFSREASGILKEIRADATKAENQADQLHSFSTRTSLDWQSHASELRSIKAEVNDMGARLCRLETIRTAVLPWQRKAIDRTAVLTREMANNTTQAIKYLDNSQGHFSSPAYRQYATNLYNESGRLSQTIGNFEKLAKLRQQEHDLRGALGTKASA